MENRQQNDIFHKQGIYPEIIRWKNFLDTLSEIRLHDKYNEVVKDRDSKDLNSRRDFQDKLANLGHFFTGYDTIEHLKRQFED